jgi:uncharacterized protein (TIGR03435 family)
MKSALVLLVSILILASLAFGQATEPLPTFEAADVHSSPRSNNPVTRGGFVRGGRYEFKQATMLDLVANAYSLEADKVLGGPSWLETDRFDIIAKAPASANNDTAKLMLRALLIDRFKLAVHNEDRPTSVYALTALKERGPQLKEASGGGQIGCQGVPQNPEPGVIPYSVIVCRNLPMDAIANVLRQTAGGYFDQPVVDMTGLKGTWDFELKWTGRGQLAAAGANGISAFDAIEKQLGLKAELQKKPGPVVVVDRVNQKPTDNLPDVAKSLPVVATEFEVGDIKPSMPGAQQRGGIQPGGRIDAQAFTLKQIMSLAWDLQEDMIIGPKWIETDKFDLVAKAPPDVIAGGNLDVLSLQVMLKTLLIERFKIKMHTEDQPVAVFALLAPKKETKLKKGDPSARSSCKRVITQGTIPTATVTCQNTTMAQLAEKLRQWAGGYVTHPAVDLTGIEGGWDFTYSWAPRANFEARPENAQPGTASDPNGAVSVFEAMEKLGLKLEQQKHPMPVVVIDSANQKPTEN